MEDYADFYFRNFPCSEGSKKKIEEMRKNDSLHKKMQRFMECCAEVQKGNMDNKFFNEQRDKYGKGARPSTTNNAPSNAGGD